MQTIKTVNNKQEYSKYEYLDIDNEKKSFEFAATEADRGGYGVYFFFVKNNRFYNYSDIINIPWTNKDLTIEYATFRDKTLPGSEEKWKIKISGFKRKRSLLKYWQACMMPRWISLKDIAGANQIFGRNILTIIRYGKVIITFRSLNQKKGRITL